MNTSALKKSIFQHIRAASKSLRDGILFGETFHVGWKVTLFA
jgi:hypothetical protein